MILYNTKQTIVLHIIQQILYVGQLRYLRRAGIYAAEKVGVKVICMQSLCYMPLYYISIVLLFRFLPLILI